MALKLDDLIPSLEPILAKAAKLDAPSTEGVSLARELIKAVVRLVFKADKIEDTKVVTRKWTDFSKKVRKAESLSEIVRAVENETL
jgi:hypothetical protein